MNDSDKKPGFGSFWEGVYWWAVLVVAVLAIPSIGFIVAAAAPDKNVTQLVVFVFTCWVCTFLGMKLMKK